MNKLLYKLSKPQLEIIKEDLNKWFKDNPTKDHCKLHINSWTYTIYKKRINISVYLMPSIYYRIE